MKAKKCAGRTILMTDEGMPALMQLTMREATTAAGRVKCALVTIENADDPDTRKIFPMPFAVPVMTPDGKKPRGFTPEFRLEMN